MTTSTPQECGVPGSGPGFRSCGSGSPTLDARVSDSQVELKWSAVPQAYRYDVHRAIKGGPFLRVQLVDAGIQTFVDKRASNGKTYCYT